MLEPSALEGLLGRLPPPMDHATIACSRDESGYAVLMHDVSEFLFEPDEAVPMGDQPIVLETIAALHARFWMDPPLRDPDLDLCTIEQVTSCLAPSIPARFRPSSGRKPPRRNARAKPGPSVLCPAMIVVPSSCRSKTSVLTAPSAWACGWTVSMAGKTALLCGTVTFAPRKPIAANPRTAVSTSPGGTGKGT